MHALFLKRSDGVAHWWYFDKPWQAFRSCLAVWLAGGSVEAYQRTRLVPTDDFISCAYEVRRWLGVTE